MSGDDTPGETVTLYRPVGPAELDLIRGRGYRAFPPRPPHQPIFYPVLTEEYAVQIARDWNTRDAASGYTGYSIDVRPDPLPENAAHALFYADPRFASRSLFKRLQERLAQMARFALLPDDEDR